MGFELCSIRDLKIEFGKRLQECRKKKYKTQQDFADALSLGDKITKIETVRNWEQGRTVPEFDTLIHIANLLDCDIDYLFSRIDDKTHDIAYIREKTDLSENAINNLISWDEEADENEPNSKKWISYISIILEDPSFVSFLKELDFAFIDMADTKSQIEGIEMNTTISESYLRKLKRDQSFYAYKINHITYDLIENLLRIKSD